MANHAEGGGVKARVEKTAASVRLIATSPIAEGQEVRPHFRRPP